ncbi:transposase [Planococcus lenghuensis]|uniref:Transposase n=1 Tax=Planococcus lenghuensis TaxID=2213202 RepID=A0A1Q2L0W0_9BACL|nr:transposase [Planococcus lenghuensis]AQQ54088.1 transposase [Planococcus lenghuensis]
MTRKRTFHPSSYYHVIMRGNNRQPIFSSKEDMFELRRAFLHVYHRYPFQMLAFCFMTNHYHLLIKTDGAPLHKIMALVNRRYSDSFSKRYSHIGRIYQKRYFAREVNSRFGLLQVSSYIHRNPIETKVPMVERLEDYPYSSFPSYWSEEKPALPFLNLELLQTLVPAPFEKTNIGYCKYCLTHRQKVEEDSHLEEMEPPVVPVSDILSVDHHYF